jgi:Ca2+-transporting ATPase
MELKNIFERLESSDTGLTDEAAHDRLVQYGENALVQGKTISPVSLFIRQFKNFLIYILITAGIISVIIGDYLDASVIFLVTILNAITGFVQEYKAERSLESLKKLIVQEANVIRNGKKMRIMASRLVPGDVIEVEAGESVPSDARIIQSFKLKVDESALTGESEPRAKSPGVLPGDIPLGDMTNMLFMGTSVIDGRAKAIVISTGMGTEIGKIAKLVESSEKEEVPLKVKLDSLARSLGILSIVFCGIIFITGYLRGESLFTMFLVSTSLVVAAIPEGLPAMVTIVLALGVQRMAKKNAIVRELPAVETLGSTTIICSDKTGTLTKNVITLQKISTMNSDINVTGTGYSIEGHFSSGDKPLDVGSNGDVQALLAASILCNNATFEKRGAEWNINGDTTEIALLVAAFKAGMNNVLVRDERPRIFEQPFSSDTRYMLTVNREGDENILYFKGAPEVVLEKCSGVLSDGKTIELTAERRNHFLERNSGMAGNGMRVLGFAFKRIRGDPVSMGLEELESGLTYMGIVGMIDPPRPEVYDAIRLCNEAGIKVVMITGDQRLTALSIARSLGIFRDGDIAVTGIELNAMSDEELDLKAEKIMVYARTSPEQKLRIVRSLKNAGEIVAMTGDGVNDAPALKSADIGVSMGLGGTDVARQASGIVLADDNFATIVSAVEEGRGIYENVRKFVKYAFTGNFGQVLAIFVGIMLGLPLPVLAIQILWINLITDSFPAVALSFDPNDKGLMKKPRKGRSTAIVTPIMLLDTAIVGIVMTAGILGIFWVYLPAGLQYAQTIVFTSIAMFKLWNSLNCRSEEKSIFSVGVFKNKYLVLAILTSVALQMFVLYFPFLEGIFVTSAPAFKDVAIAMLMPASVVVAIELRKIVTNLLK